MASVLSVSVNGTVSNPASAAVTVGLPTRSIYAIVPFSGTQPIAGVTILTVIKMKARGTRVATDNYLSHSNSYGHNCG